MGTTPLLYRVSRGLSVLLLLLVDGAPGEGEVSPPEDLLPHLPPPPSPPPYSIGSAGDFLFCSCSLVTAPQWKVRSCHLKIYCHNYHHHHHHHHYHNNNNENTLTIWEQHPYFIGSAGDFLFSSCSLLTAPKWKVRSRHLKIYCHNYHHHHHHHYHNNNNEKTLTTWEQYPYFIGSAGDFLFCSCSLLTAPQVKVRSRHLKMPSTPTL